MKKSTAPAAHFAVIASGIDEEYQNHLIHGINTYAREHNANLSYFSAFGGIMESQKYDIGEYNIYNLINYSRFDGFILLTNTICASEIRKKICDAVLASGKPAVIFDDDTYPTFYNIRIDNLTAMHELVNHIITEHHCRTINYISGPQSNPEANARFQAFCDAMAEHGLPVEKDRIFFGEFRSLDGRKAVEAFLETGLPMPDAVICANDAMALSAINVLEDAGYCVPEDILVTGFDDTYYARNHQPPLTTVKRPLAEAGALACEILCKRFAGEEFTHTMLLKAEPVFTESCGCSEQFHTSETDFRKRSYYVMEHVSMDINLLNQMTSSLADAESIEQAMTVVKQILTALDCERFYVCLCDGWQGDISHSWDAQYVNGYPRKMSAPLVYRHPDVFSIEQFDSADMYPEELTGSGHVSFFFPLHFREHCIGYYIISDSSFPVDSIVFRSILMNISHAFENIRRLLQLNNVISELERMYVIDPLCDILNRGGFTREAEKILRACLHSGRRITVVFIDLDGLKEINDIHGHEEGDFALQFIAETVKSSVPEHFICARFGGDEFVILGAERAPDEAAEMERTIQAKLNAFNEAKHKAYPIEVSIGHCSETVTNSTKLYQIITLADEKMYTQKKLKKQSKYIRR